MPGGLGRGQGSVVDGDLVDLPLEAVAAVLPSADPERLGARRRPRFCLGAKLGLDLAVEVDGDSPAVAAQDDVVPGPSGDPGPADRSPIAVAIGEPARRGRGPADGQAVAPSNKRSELFELSNSSDLFP